MIPMNLMKNGVADYIITGQWAKKAWQEAQKYGQANAIASSADKTFTYIPDCSDLPINEKADYVYICENNTIYGTKYKKLPNTKGHTLVADVSSCFLSEPVDVTKYGIIYGGVQKNIGPAGMVIAIEPMVTMGSNHVSTGSDGWIVTTNDHLPAAHYENTVAITNDGPVILTTDAQGAWCSLQGGEM